MEIWKNKRENLIFVIINPWLVIIFCLIESNVNWGSLSLDKFLQTYFCLVYRTSYIISLTGMKFLVSISKRKDVNTRIKYKYKFTGFQLIQGCPPNVQKSLTRQPPLLAPSIDSRWACEILNLGRSKLTKKLRNIEIKH